MWLLRTIEILSWLMTIVAGWETMHTSTFLPSLTGQKNSVIFFVFLTVSLLLSFVDKKVTKKTSVTKKQQIQFGGKNNRQNMQ